MVIKLGRPMGPGCLVLVIKINMFPAKWACVGGPY